MPSQKPLKRYLTEAEIIGATVGSSFGVLFFKLLKEQWLLGETFIDVNLIALSIYLIVLFIGLYLKALAARLLSPKLGILVFLMVCSLGTAILGGVMSAIIAYRS